MRFVCLKALFVYYRYLFYIWTKYSWLNCKKPNSIVPTHIKLDQHQIFQCTNFTSLQVSCVYYFWPILGRFLPLSGVFPPDDLDKCRNAKKKTQAPRAPRKCIAKCKKRNCSKIIFQFVRGFLPGKNILCWINSQQCTEHLFVLSIGCEKKATLLNTFSPSKVNSFRFFFLGLCCFGLFMSARGRGGGEGRRGVVVNCDGRWRRLRSKYMNNNSLVQSKQQVKLN